MHNTTELNLTLPCKFNTFVYLCILAVGQLFSPQVLGSTLSKKSIQVGESFVFDSKKSEGLNISRKGVLHVSELKGGKIRLTGIRAGFVVVTSELSQRTVHVWVTKNQPPPNLPAKTASPPEELEPESPFPEWICAFEYVTCSTPFINGMMHQHRAHTLAKKACTSSSDCIFLVKLGSPIRVHDHFFLVHQNSDQSSGLSLSTPRVKAPIEDFSPGIHLEVIDKHYRDHLQTIADPSLILVPGVDSSLSSGGEFLTSIANDSAEPSSRWVSHGMSIKLKFHPLSESTVALDYDMSLKNKSSQSALQSHEFTGQIILEKGVPKVAGQLDLDVDRRGQSDSPIFGKIPSVGPVFSSKKQGDQQTKILVMVSYEQP